jgi:alkaline phosphatase
VILGGGADFFLPKPAGKRDVGKDIIADRNFSYPTQNALGRMVSRQTGIYRGTSGHSTEPVIVGAIGPGAERFKGYMDNADFGKILQQVLERR